MAAAAATTVAVPRLAAPLRVFHMSDSHVDRGTDLGYEGSAMNFGTAMHNRYEHVPDPREGEARAAKKAHTSFWREPDVVGVDGSKPTENSYHAGDGGPPEGMVRPYEIFEEQLALAQQEGAELLVHTGNLVNFPSFRAVYYCWDALENCGLPYLFTAGSADWCWQDMVGTKPVAELRQQYCWDENGEIATFFSRGKDYAPTYDPPAWSELVGGLRFVGVDNSTQLVSAEQTAFVVEALGAAAAAGESAVLCAHMPLYTPELAAALAAEQGLGPAHIDWNIDGTLDGNTALCGDPSARQMGAHGASTEPSDIPVDAPTAAFLEAVSTAPNLVAVLSGHVQATLEQPFGEAGCMQYVVGAGFEGAHRWLEFVPAGAAKL